MSVLCNNISSCQVICYPACSLAAVQLHCTALISQLENKRLDITVTLRDSWPLLPFCSLPCLLLSSTLWTSFSSRQPLWEESHQSSGWSWDLGVLARQEAHVSGRHGVLAWLEGAFLISLTGTSLTAVTNKLPHVPIWTLTRPDFLIH